MTDDLIIQVWYGRHTIRYRLNDADVYNKRTLKYAASVTQVRSSVSVAVARAGRSDAQLTALILL